MSRWCNAPCSPSLAGCEPLFSPPQTSVCVCVRVCACERERERNRDRESLVQRSMFAKLGRLRVQPPQTRESVCLCEREREGANISLVQRSVFAKLGRLRAPSCKPECVCLCVCLSERERERVWFNAPCLPSSAGYETPPHANEWLFLRERE